MKKLAFLFEKKKILDVGVKSDSTKNVKLISYFEKENVLFEVFCGACYNNEKSIGQRFLLHTLKSLQVGFSIHLT